MKNIFLSIVRVFSVHISNAVRVYSERKSTNCHGYEINVVFKEKHGIEEWAY